MKYLYFAATAHICCVMPTRLLLIEWLMGCVDCRFWFFSVWLMDHCFEEYYTFDCLSYEFYNNMLHYSQAGSFANNSACNILHIHYTYTVSYCSEQKQKYQLYKYLKITNTLLRLQHGKYADGDKWKRAGEKAVLSTKGENLCIVFLVKHTESAEKRMNYEVNPILWELLKLSIVQIASYYKLFVKM